MWGEGPYKEALPHRLKRESQGRGRGPRQERKEEPGSHKEPGRMVEKPKRQVKKWEVKWGEERDPPGRQVINAGG